MSLQASPAHSSTGQKGNLLASIAKSKEGQVWMGFMAASHTFQSSTVTFSVSRHPSSPTAPETTLTA